MIMKDVLVSVPDEKILALLKEHKGNYTLVAKALGVHRSSIYRWKTRYDARFKTQKKKADDGPKEFFRKPVAGLDSKSQDRGNDIPQRVFPAGASRLVITSAVNATPAHEGFLNALEGYCEHTGAELIVIPLRYRNPTSLWSDSQDHDDWWTEELAKYIYASRKGLADDLVLLADIKTQPTAADPLSGLHAITGSASAIVGHPQIALTTIPTPQTKLPKLLVSTGAVTVANYSPTKAGARGEFAHSLGAVVVEFEEGGAFHIRHINAEDTGAFHDLQHAYYPDRTWSENGGVAALILGDAHVDFIDPEVVDAVFTGDDAMAHVLRPQMLVWHDILDCYSISHHHEHDPLIKYVKHHNKRGNAREEIQRCFDFIDTHSPESCLNVIVGSNHNDHLGRWVRDTDPRKDPENALLWAELYHEMCMGAKMGTGGAETIDPLQYLAGSMLKSNSRTKWPSRGESFAVHGIELGMHGDRGPNGARGSRKALDKIGTRSVIGHSHSPGITGGCYQVGTSSRYNLEYAAGAPSSWLHTMCVVYRNGKRSLLNCVGNRWRGDDIG